MSVMAETTAKTQLTLSSQSGQTCVTTLIEKTELNSGFNKGYCAEIKMEDREVALYAIFNGKNYQTFGSNDLDGLAFGVMTDVATEYTISFSNVEGKLYLVDGEKFIEITEGGSYTFTAAANQTIADRFSISKYPPYLFIGHKLILGDKKPGSVAKAKSFEYQDGKRVFTGHDVSGDGATLLLFQPSYYEVTYTNRKDEEKKFIVNVNPTVTPAN